MSKGRAPRRLGAIAAAIVAVASAGMTASGAGAAPTDDAIERKAVLRMSDFPAGWEKTPRRAVTRSGLDVCSGLDDVNATLATVSARSPEFVRPDSDNVLAANAVVVLKSVRQTRAYLDAYRDPDAVRCLERLTESSLSEAGFSAVGAYVTPTDDVPSGADEAAGFGIEITVTAPATSGRVPQTAVLYQDLLLVRVGRALASFGFLGPGAPLSEQGELVDAVIGRLEDALRS